jgi:hypothetical protein
MPYRTVVALQSDPCADIIVWLRGNGLIRSRLSSLVHQASYFDIVIVCIVGAVLGLVAVIALGSTFGSFS